MPLEADMNRRNSNRAVSPVIGVILMVAITVILAAVIGAFVLEIGDQQETAPNTSFDSEESVNVYYTSRSDGRYNLTNVEATHAGGDSLDLSQIQLKVNGDPGVWGPDPDEPLKAGGPSSGCFENGFQTYVTPHPDPRAFAGSNEVVSLTSGESLTALLYNRELQDYEDGTLEKGSGPQELDNTCYQILDRSSGGFRVIGSKHGTAESGEGNDDVPNSDALEAGNTVRITWEAQSGGKSQTLFEYTVQTTSPEL